MISRLVLQGGLNFAVFSRVGASAHPAAGDNFDLAIQLQRININQQTMEANNKHTEQQIYIGMWVTADGYIRQELLPNGRYDEARGNRQSAYTGRYEINGTHINYWDDTGFTADGDFTDNDTLRHGGYIFYREK